MMDAQTKRFLLDIIEEVRRMEVIKRNCANLLSNIKPNMPYDVYISMHYALCSLDESIMFAFLKFLEVKEELCDTPQQ